MPYQHLIRSTDGQLGIITLNRPERRNALSLELMSELIRCLDELTAEPNVRAIILEPPARSSARATISAKWWGARSPNIAGFSMFAPS